MQPERLSPLKQHLAPADSVQAAFREARRYADALDERSRTDRAQLTFWLTAAFAVFVFIAAMMLF